MITKDEDIAQIIADGRRTGVMNFRFEYNDFYAGNPSALEQLRDRALWEIGMVLTAWVADERAYTVKRLPVETVRKPGYYPSGASTYLAEEAMTTETYIVLVGLADPWQAGEGEAIYYEREPYENDRYCAIKDFREERCYMLRIHDKYPLWHRMAARPGYNIP